MCGCKIYLHKCEKHKGMEIENLLCPYICCYGLEPHCVDTMYFCRRSFELLNAKCSKNKVFHYTTMKMVHFSVSTDIAIVHVPPH